MTKEKYKEELKKHGYKIEGDYTYIDTPWGVWKQKIVEVGDPLFGSFGLESVNNPLESIRR